MDLKPLYHIEYSVAVQYSCPEVSISPNVVYPNLLRISSIFSVISEHGQSTSIRMNFNHHLYSSSFSSIKLSNPPPFSHLYTLPAPNHLHFPSHSSPSGRQGGSQPCGFVRVSSRWWRSAPPSAWLLPRVLVQCSSPPVPYEVRRNYEWTLRRSHMRIC